MNGWIIHLWLMNVFQKIVIMWIWLLNNLFSFYRKLLVPLLNFIWNKNGIWIRLISPLFVYKANTKSLCTALEWIFVQWIDQWTWQNPTYFVLYPPSRSSITMTSSGLNESGQQVMFVHLNDFPLSLMTVGDIIIALLFFLQSQWPDSEKNLMTTTYVSMSRYPIGIISSLTYLVQL